MGVAHDDFIEYNHEMQKDCKNILIIKPSAMGDIIMALPSLASLRKSFPKARISWLVRPEFAPLLAGHPFLDEIIIFDRKFLGKAWYDPKAMAALISLIRQLRQGRFDIVFDFQGLFRTAAFSWLSGCRNRFGMTVAREFAGIFYTRKIPYDMECIHVVDYYLKMVRSAGADCSEPVFILPQNQTADDSVSKLLKNKGISGGCYAVFAPGSVHSDKCWPAERYAALADKIVSKFGIRVIAIGTEAEKSIVDEIKKKAGTSIIDLAGATNINELTALIKAARFMVGNDTGPTHIAAALGKPVVMIFGRSNPARVAPYGREDSVAAVNPYGRGIETDSSDPRYDIKAVTVDEVFQKICRQIS